MADAKYEAAVQRQMNEMAARMAGLRNAALNCAEYLEGIIRDDFDGGCSWPDVDGTHWCSKFCDTHGCAKSRSHQCRVAIAEADAGVPLGSKAVVS